MDRTIFKKILSEIITSSTSHGLPNIIRSDRILIKILWILSTFISGSICTYLIIESIMKYYQYDVITKIRVTEEITTEFPTITVCNLNLFTNKKSLDALQNLNLSTFPNNLYFQIQMKFSVDQNELNLYGDSKEKLVRYLFMNHEKISLDTIVHYTHPEYGNCFKINSGFTENKTEIPIVIAMDTQTKKKIILLNYINSYLIELDNLDKICVDDCPIECEKETFSKTISMYDLGNKEWENYYREYYNMNETDLDIRNDLVGINIYYDSLGYTEITEMAAIDLVTLLSSIGGFAGLFLGISFLSLMESMEFLCQIILVFYDYNTKKNNVVKIFRNQILQK
ncbi:unnamed protein product [Brachionus calyciflorus]|uniref:Uncharacterized protein n=1 Tax=Brachionus calyciflorus TaxID=104777 RepID=A0A814GE21_9BILA|nr:unnamed protein product [Brachionus calyciflorus]